MVLTAFQASAVAMALVGAFAWANHRFLKLPAAVGAAAVGLAFSLAIALGAQLYPPAQAYAAEVVSELNFREAVFHGMLCFLLFAGALHVDLSALRRHGLEVFTFATIGVALSIAIFAALFWGLSSLAGWPLSFLECALLGAIVSPTDPVAVMAILERLGLPDRLQAKIAGESLFNDGTGVVAFLAILPIALAADGGGPAASASAASVAWLLVSEVSVGAIVGVALGALCLWALRGVEDLEVETFLTIALAIGAYALAEALHGSAPIAAVVAGLLIGNHGPKLAISEPAREKLFEFWHMADALLNLLLFGLIGLVMAALDLSWAHWAAAALAIPAALIARFGSVALPVRALRPWREFDPHAIKIMTWGGLKGGISVALALSIPEGPAFRDWLVAGAYGIVLFSVLAQATTAERLFARWMGRP